MSTDPTQTRHLLARCQAIVAEQLDVLLTSHCRIDYPNGIEKEGTVRRETLDPELEPQVTEMEQVLDLLRQAAAFEVGQRVALGARVEIFDLGTWDVGTTGTVTWANHHSQQLAPGLIALVKLDGNHRALNEWDGCLQVYFDKDDDCAWWKWHVTEPAR